MSYRSILLHLDASPRSAARLRLARELAAVHDARVTALYATTPSVFSVPFALAEGNAELLPMLQQLDVDHRDEAKEQFDRIVSEGTQAVQWRELDSHPVIPGVVQHALCADLLVLGQHDRKDLLTTGIPADFIESIVIGSGKPALIVPYVDICASVGQNILIAWKAARESARAVSAAIPMLRHARQIHVTTDEESRSGPASGAMLESFLRSHGVLAPIEHHPALLGDTPGDDLLSLAANAGADLLVMGCYGHARARELVLGGASRTVLRSMTLPVLMAH
jgi:nucleotide-binding universal stress UspA family protein